MGCRYSKQCLSPWLLSVQPLKYSLTSDVPCLLSGDILSAPACPPPISGSSSPGLHKNVRAAFLRLSFTFKSDLRKQVILHLGEIWGFYLDPWYHIPIRRLAWITFWPYYLFLPSSVICILIMKPIWPTKWISTSCKFTFEVFAEVTQCASGSNRKPSVHKGQNIP